MDLSSYGFVDTASVDESETSSSVASTPGAMSLTPKIMTGDQCCHHFQSQNVFTSEHEPLVLCATDDQVFLATHMANGNCQIEVRCMSDPGCPVLHTFPTITPVKSIIYNKEGQYIATLEEKIRGTQRDTFSHIYLHWDISGDNQPLKARVAGKITDLTGQSDRMNSIEVIEILTKRGPNCIACCEKTGNIAISWGNSVTIFKFIVKMFNNEQYKDFIRIMEIDFNFKTKKCCLNENVLAVCSDDSVQVVTINLSEKVPRFRSDAVSQYESQRRDDEEYSCDSVSAGFEKIPSVCRTDSSDSGGKFVSDDYVIVDEAVITWTFVDEDIKDYDRGLGQYLPKTVHLPTLQKAVESDAATSQHLTMEVLGPRSNIPGQNAKINIKDKDISMNYEPSITTLIFRRLPILMDSALHTIQLLPVYTPESMDPSSSLRGLKSLNPLKSVNFNKLVSLCCFVSNARRGYLYNLLGEVELLCRYPYAEPTKNVALSDTLVHTVTDKGLLTYTARHFVPGLFKLKKFDNIETACPSSDLDVCLFGTQPFIGIQSICLTNSHVVLLNKVQHEDCRDEDSSWSMYALKSSTIVALCTEVHELTSSLRHMSPADHVHLLQESQLLIQYAMLHGLEQDEIEMMFRMCCTMLGDYYAMPDHEDWMLAVPYYKMAGMTVPEVIQRHYEMFVGPEGIEFKDLCSMEYGDGLVAYLIHVLFEAGDPFTLEEKLGDFVLAAMASKCPHRLAEVVAVSRLKDFSDAHAELILCELMSKQPKMLSALHKLVRAILKLRLGEPHDAKMLLTSMSKTDIVSLCTKHHQLLHENLSKLTDLAQLLRSLHRTAITEILVNLLDKKIIGLNNTLELLQGPEEGAGSNGHVREYLEAVLADDSRKFWFTDAASMLSKIYLSNLKSWEPPAVRAPEKSHSHIPKGNGHFVKRHPWLNELPPFTGPNCISRPCLYLRTSVKSSSPPQPSPCSETCTCCCCNEDLLKLQSLLCSSHASSSLHHDVLYDLEESAKVKGRDSLQILCLAQTDPLSATDKVLQTFPLILPQFSKEMLGEDGQKWAHVAEKVTTLVRQSSEKKDLYKKVYEGLLTEIAETLPIKEFLRLLPADGNLSFFVPYIEKSYRSSATCGLKEKIIHNGETLYSGSSSLSW